MIQCGVGNFEFEHDSEQSFVSHHNMFILSVLFCVSLVLSCCVCSSQPNPLVLMFTGEGDVPVAVMIEPELTLGELTQVWTLGVG